LRSSFPFVKIHLHSLNSYYCILNIGKFNSGGNHVCAPPEAVDALQDFHRKARAHASKALDDTPTNATPEAGYILEDIQQFAMPEAETDHASDDIQRFVMPDTSEVVFLPLFTKVPTLKRMMHWMTVVVWNLIHFIERRHLMSHCFQQMSFSIGMTCMYMTTK
jgi:hypothetical protein